MKLFNLICVVSILVGSAYAQASCGVEFCQPRVDCKLTNKDNVVQYEGGETFFTQGSDQAGWVSLTTNRNLKYTFQLHLLPPEKVGEPLKLEANVLYMPYEPTHPDFTVIYTVEKLLIGEAISGTKFHIEVTNDYTLICEVGTAPLIPEF